MLSFANDDGWRTLAIGGQTHRPKDLEQDDESCLTRCFCGAQGTRTADLLHAIDSRPVWWTGPEAGD
jgi:hypothetical protein